AIQELVIGGWNAMRRGDCETALHLLGEAAAAPEGPASFRASGMLGDLAEAGRCMKQDDRLALQHYQRAAKGRNAPASFDIGVVASRLRDFAMAAAAYRDAAELGYARAQSTIGSFYENGTGVERDGVAAVEWFRKAA